VLDSLYLRSCAKQTAHMLISPTIELASLQLVSKFLRVSMRTNFMSFSTSSVCSLCFVLWTRIENQTPQTWVDIKI